MTLPIVRIIMVRILIIVKGGPFIHEFSLSVNVRPCHLFKVTEAFSRLEEDTFRDIPPERVQEFMELFRELYLRMQRNFDTGEPAK